ncbi:helix-turn-helix transcriptional regulator [Alkalihalobacterium alkalinitrilicum]|uniref:helix-turn-helix transcriptional regulator n=1 Tax=Alkalihalobacterium alkalinitrilicum TaxID=427920 RepID=UPI000995575F|nr:helix-turn-helix domain-containing protein [Alkalihalobacterium alkalinitrilicum]
MVKCRLRVILAERNIKHGEVYKKAGISSATFSLLVNEKSLPTLPVALKIARVLDLHIEDIWYEDGKEVKH